MLPRPAPFTVSVAADVPYDLREALRLTLEADADVQEVSTKSLDWAMVVVVIVAIGTVADGATKMLGLVEKIIDLREKAHQRGTPLRGRLARPDQPALDLEHASEEALLAWLLNEPPGG
jgi:hypothetical protein